MANFILYQYFRYFTLYAIYILLVASITISLCFFFLFLIVFKNFFTNPVAIEKVRLQLSLIIPTGAPITVANDAIEILPVIVDKAINDLSKYSRKRIYLLRFFLISSPSLISAIK